MHEHRTVGLERLYEFPGPFVPRRKDILFFVGCIAVIRFQMLSLADFGEDLVPFLFEPHGDGFRMLARQGLFLFGQAFLKPCDDGILVFGFLLEPDFLLFLGLCQGFLSFGLVLRIGRGINFAEGAHIVFRDELPEIQFFLCYSRERIFRKHGGKDFLCGDIRPGVGFEDDGGVFLT